MTILISKFKPEVIIWSKSFHLSQRKDSPALLLGQTTNNFVLLFLGFYFEALFVVWELKLSDFG